MPIPMSTESNKYEQARIRKPFYYIGSTEIGRHQRSQSMVLLSQRVIEDLWLDTKDKSAFQQSETAEKNIACCLKGSNAKLQNKGDSDQQSSHTISHDTGGTDERMPNNPSDKTYFTSHLKRHTGVQNPHILTTVSA